MRKVQQRENATSPSTSAGTTVNIQPADLENEIRHRAYEIWQNSGHPDGHDLEHWLQAEVEIRAARSKAA
jgi:hypothetical protein